MSNIAAKVSGNDIFNVIGGGVRIQIGSGQNTVSNNSQINIEISKQPEGVYFCQ